jgi:serine/threonine protein kinase
MLVNHPGIVSAVEYVSSSEMSSPLVINGKTFQEYSYILLPFHSNGTLLDLLKKAQAKSHSLSMSAIQYLFKQLVRALAHLHQVNRLTHCDLKPENLILTDDF